MAVSKGGQPIRSLDDWRRLAPPKSPHHWVRGRSAQELARAWLDAEGIAEECNGFATTSVLCVELEVPNAASRVVMEADFMRRSIRFSVTLNTPEDRARPTAAINWATRQLSSLAGTSQISDVVLRVRWPYRAPDTVAPLADAMNDAKILVPHDKKDLPSEFQIQRVVDLGARFKGSSTFVEDARRELPRFYKDVVQNVANWVAKPPAYREPVGHKAESIAIPREVPAQRPADAAASGKAGVATEQEQLLNEPEVAQT